MTFEAIISTLTLITSFAVKLIGAPSQVRHIIKTKSSASVSLLQWLLVFASYLLWFIHGILQKDNVVIFGQGIGILTSGVIVFFIIKYRTKDE